MRSITGGKRPLLLYDIKTVILKLHYMNHMRRVRAGIHLKVQRFHNRLFAGFFLTQKEADVVSLRPIFYVGKTLLCIKVCEKGINENVQLCCDRSRL